MRRRGHNRSTRLRLKQLCNHPAQLTGAADYAPADSGKFQRLAEICSEIASRQEKALVFTQFRELAAPLQHHLTAIFGRPGLILHGSVPVKERRALVGQFQRDDGPPFFILSLKAGGTGLTLTQAAHVIHFDRWWNPAVENQATDRAYRIGQKKNVLVHKFICRGTLEEKIDALIAGKKQLSEEILGPESGGETLLTEMRDDELLKFVSLDLRAALGE
jgi:non-specific serine/threonine protein kinase